MPKHQRAKRYNNKAYFPFFKVVKTQQEQTQVKDFRAWSYCHKGFPNGRHLCNVLGESGSCCLIRKAPPDKIQYTHANDANNANQRQRDAKTTNHCLRKRNHLRNQQDNTHQQEPMGKVNWLLLVDKFIALSQDDLTN